MGIDLGSARARAESLMSSTCSVAPPGAVPVTDPVTGDVTFPAGIAVYTGPCRVRPVTSRGGGTIDVGGAEMFSFDYLVSLPFTATGPKEGHRLTVTASADPSLVGVVMEVQKVDRGEHITARRLSCNEVT